MFVLEKTSRRLFDSSANEEDAANLGSKKTLFRTYRNQSHDDSFNESLISTPNLCGYAINDNQYNSPGFKERNLKLADVDKGLEVIGRGLAKDQQVIWREYWSFLDEFIDIGSNEGLSKFEKYLQDRMDGRMKPPPIALAHRKLQLAPLPVTPVSKISQKLNRLHIEKDQNDESFNHARASTPSSPSAFHAYLCVEKSCQIYAKRLLKPIAQNPTNIVTVNDVLVGELNRLKSLICSYKHDLRFFGVDFQATHARFAHIVIASLNDDPEYQKHIVKDLKITLEHILTAKEKSALNSSKNGTNSDDHSKNMAQMICLIKKLLKRLTDSSGLVSPETLTTEMDCADIWRSEEKCDCEWINTSNHKVNRSIQRKTQRLSETLNFNDFCDKLNHKFEVTETDEEDDDTFWVRILKFFLEAVWLNCFCIYFQSVGNSDVDDSSSDGEFFTPPESPVLEFFDDSDHKIHYDNFIFGYVN